MPALLLYLLKVNVALLLFFLAYHLVLRRLTFYHLNRRFLLFGILFSTVYPFIDITPFLNRHQELPLSTFTTVQVWVTTTPVAAPTPGFDFWQIPVYLFWLGAGVMAVRLVLQFVSLYRIHAASEPSSHNGIGFRQVRSISQAFSFWQNIYLNPDQHKREELESILRHELVHVRGWHTLDVLLAEVSSVFYWFNPGAWLMKKGIKENLEFIADQDVVRAGADKKEYQYLLLKATGATEPQLALPFSFPSLKRRIAMLNKMPTKKANRLRLLVVLPIVVVLLLAFRSASEQVPSPNQQEALTAETTAAALPVLQQEETLSNPASDEALQDDDKVYIPDAANQPDDYKDFLNRNPQVKQVGWKGSKKNVLVIFRNTGATEMYNLLDEKSRAAAESKFGRLPVLPPPPAPVQLRGEIAPPPPPAPVAPLAPAVPEAAKLIDSENIVSYIFNPNNFTEDEFTAAQKLFTKHDYQLTFEKQYDGGILNQLKLSANSQWGSVSGTYDVQALKRKNYVVLLKIDREKGSIGVTSQPASPPLPLINKTQISIELREDVPRFTGDRAALAEYLSKNIKYPKTAIDKRLQGDVVVEFTVEKDGSITNKKVTAPHDALAFQIFNALNAMPKWLPAEASDPKPVFVFRFKTEFKLIEK